MAYEMIQVGTGGMGSNWCQTFLPPNVEDGLIDVVAAVDIDDEALEHARDGLSLSADQCYTDAKAAFEEHASADFCTVVVPPEFHEDIVDLAIEYDMHILSEKPIADTLEGSVRIAKKVERAGKKMGVTMSHRYDRDKTTLRRELRSGAYGPLDYSVLRFICNYRYLGDWGAVFRHEMADPLLIEGSVHHLDILADLAESNCETVYAESWTPEWGAYEGDCNAFVTLTFEDGTRAMYEGAKTNAVGMNCWAHEYIRTENKEATHVLDSRELIRYDHDASESGQRTTANEPSTVPLLEQGKWTHTWLIEQFVDWLDGGPEMETNVKSNLQSVAMVFAAIESAHTGQPVAVQEMLEETIDTVDIG